MAHVRSSARLESNAVKVATATGYALGLVKLTRANDGNQCRTAPDHITQQMPAQKTGSGASPACGTNPKYGEHPRSRGDAVDKTRSQNGQ